VEKAAAPVLHPPSGTGTGDLAKYLGGKGEEFVRLHRPPWGHVPSLHVIQKREGGGLEGTLKSMSRLRWVQKGKTGASRAGRAGFLISIGVLRLHS